MQLDANILIGEYQKEIMKIQSELIMLRAIVAQKEEQEEQEQQAQEEENAVGEPEQ